MLFWFALPLRGAHAWALCAQEERSVMNFGLLALIGPLGLPELVIILFIVILIFGANRLSGLGKGLGQAIRGFKDEVKVEDKAESTESQGDS